MATLTTTIFSAAGSSTVTGGVQGTLVLDPKAKATTLQLTTALTTGAVQIEMSLDDPSQYGGATATWALLSSGTAMLTSVVAVSGLNYTILSPLGAVRINSTASSTGTIVLKALQAVTA